jgi:hypothetical protein
MGTISLPLCDDSDNISGTPLGILGLRKWLTRAHLSLGLFNYAYILSPAPRSFVYLDYNSCLYPKDS